MNQFFFKVRTLKTLQCKELDKTRVNEKRKKYC